MTTEDATELYKRADIEGNALGDEVVFFDDRVGKYFATGSVGADIWRLLETPQSLNGLVQQLIDIYEVDEATCRAETKVFLEQMIEVELIQKA